MTRNPAATASRTSIIVFVVALAVRLAFLTEFAQTPLFYYFGLDSAEYDEMARGLLDGSWPGPYAFSRPPLYSLFLALLYGTVGSGFVALRVVHALVGATSCLVLYRLARELVGSERVARIAAGVTALCGPLVVLDLQLLPNALDVLLFLSTLALLLRAGRSPSAWPWLTAGLLTALGAVNRGASLLLLPVALAWLFVATPRRSRVVVSALAYLAPIALLLFPLIWHNASNDVSARWRPRAAAVEESTWSRIFRGQFVLIASNAGVNFYLGNHGEAVPINDTNHPEHFDRYEAIEASPYTAGVYSTAAANRYLVQATLQDMRDAPGGWLARLGIKGLRLINGSEIARNTNLYAYGRDSLVARLLLWRAGIAFPTGLLLPLGLLGIFLVRREWRRHWVAWGGLAALAAYMLLFFVTARYRAPMLPLLAIYAAIAIEQMRRWLRERDRTRLLLAGGALAVLCLLSLWPVVRIDRDYGVHERTGLAYALLQQGRADEAARQLEGALEARPGAPRVRLLLALARRQQGRADEAVEIYRQILVEDVGNIEAHNELALALADLGQAAAAERQWRLGLSHVPDACDARANLATLLAQQERREESVAEFRRAIEKEPRCATAYANLGALLEREGRVDQARGVYRVWERNMPDDAEARSRLTRLR